MSNIRVDLGYTIRDGAEIKFRSPVDCSQITGLIVYYPGADGNTTSKVFAFADAHGNNVGNIDHLFAENVMVKVILDVTKGMAFVQNADTNAYLEAQLASKRPNTWLPTIAEIGAAPAGYGLGANGASSDYTTVNSSEADALNKSGLYVFFDDANPITNTINSGGRGLILHLQQSFYYTIAATQKFYPMYVSGHLERKKLDGSGEWQPWEWVDPPMGVDVEYRTTERWQDRAVYCKMINCGALPNATSYYTELEPNCRVIRCSGRAVGSVDTITLPFISDSTTIVNVHGVQNRVYVYASYNASSFTSTYVTAWYIKL